MNLGSINWSGGLTLGGVIFVMLVGIKGFASLRSSRSKKSEQVEERMSQHEIDATVEWPKCDVCSMAATEPKPTLVTRRSGWIRSFLGLFAATPLYRRRVPTVERVEDLCFCGTCAPLADAMLDRFVMQEVRGMQARVNEDIAASVAQFLREGLVQRMRGVVGKKDAPPQMVSAAPVSRLPLRSITTERAVGSE